MKFIAGFLGIGQNPTTGALRPCLGWVTALPNPEQSTGKNQIVYSNNILSTLSYLNKSKHLIRYEKNQDNNTSV